MCFLRPEYQRTNTLITVNSCSKKRGIKPAICCNVIASNSPAGNTETIKTRWRWVTGKITTVSVYLILFTGWLFKWKGWVCQLKVNQGEIWSSRLSSSSSRWSWCHPCSDSMSSYLPCVCVCVCVCVCGHMNFLCPCNPMRFSDFTGEWLH